MTPEQLDLFAWSETIPTEEAMRHDPVAVGGAAILAFPVARKIGLARRIAAAILERQSSQAQQSLFDREARALAGKLTRAGLSDEAVERELLAFTRAVNDELCRRQMSGRQRPGGAA
jgi:hypothetical protein